VGSALTAFAVVLVLALAVAPGGDPPGWTEESVLVNGVRETDGLPVTLDSTIYLPAHTPAPAVLLAHGYGSSKAGVTGQARKLAQRGYVVLTWSARGFGGSGGQLHLDSPDYEVKDAKLMLDELARRPEVSQDAKGDPHVGVVGASYGGALALLLAGTDHRVDALVPSITWNNLRQALFPQFITRSEQITAAGSKPIAETGVFKRQWMALLLGASAAGASTGDEEATGPPGAAASQPSSPNYAGGSQAMDLATLKAACGRIATDLCLGYLQAATTGRPDKALLKLLVANSPARVADKITAPTLLIQGQTDSLFPLSEADANAQAIASAGTEVQVIWQAGGHDGGIDESARLEQITAEFLDRTLGHHPPGSSDADSPTPGFRVTVPDAVVSSIDTNPAPQLRAARTFPGLPVAGTGAGGGPPLRLQKLPLAGGRQLAISPPGGVPASLTSLPGASGALGLLGAASGSTGSGMGLQSGSGPESGAGAGAGLNLGVLPGQHAAFDTAPLAAGISITGSSRVTVRITASSTDATLFASLLDVGPDGGTTMPRQLVSPIRLARVPAAGQVVTIALPAIVRDVPAGHRLRVVLSSTDQGYAVPVGARGYQISLAGDSMLSVPVIGLTVERSGSAHTLLIAAVLLAAAILLAVLAFSLRNRWVRRRTVVDVDPDLVDVPLDISGLGKAYGDGFRAVSDVSFRVEAGQVLGLLGPNGAGKTTTLRMLMGLILPTEGGIRIFGHRVTPGAAVLSRLGSFIEGPGFLPHLSGAENLELYWRSTGRQGADSGMAVALEIAGLGDDVHRKVRTYSQGMRQRLAIAQAMLGLPDLLVLDEPTNGLDPPQIREMRAVLGRYAATGRTVVVSSHLLAEVEQTCSHVVVMAGGRLIAQGTVAELIGAARSMLVDVDDPVRAGQVAALVRSLGDVRMTPTGLLVRADPVARGQLIRALVLANIRVDRVAPQRGLEETFFALIGEAE
jgi:ABC-2 type transport system ATP-binding protein